MTTNQYPYPETAYTTEVIRETLSNGEKVYVARHPELDGCMAHGSTIEEAKSNLSEAFELSMDHLIKYRLPVPKPNVFALQEPAANSQSTVISPPKDTSEVYIRLATMRMGVSSPLSLAVDTGDLLALPKQSQ